jgi:hypothetical protein
LSTPSPTSVDAAVQHQQIAGSTPYPPSSGVPPTVSKHI